MRAVIKTMKTMVLSVLLLAACGGDAGTASTTGPTVVSASEPAPTTPSTPVATVEAAPIMPATVVDSTGTSIEIASVDRIIPVDGDLAEIVFALGLGDHVVATDLSATYPPEADALPQIGYQRALNTEPIASLDPTLVLATDLARPLETLDQLRDLHIPVVVIQRDMTVNGPAAKVRAVAAALGVPERGEALVQQMNSEIESATATAATMATHPRVLMLYLRGSGTQLIFGKGSGIDASLAAVGAVDVASELGVVDYQQLTAESIIVAAPDVIMVTTTGLESVGGIDGLLQIDGIGRTPAGRLRHVLVYEDQFMLGLGPRYGQFLGQLASDLAAIAP